MSNKKLKKENPMVLTRSRGRGWKGGFGFPLTVQKCIYNFSLLPKFNLLTLHLTVNSIAGENKQHPLTNAFLILNSLQHLPYDVRVTPTSGEIAQKIHNFCQNIAFRSQTRIFFPNVPPKISSAISKLPWTARWTCFMAIQAWHFYIFLAPF